MKKLSVGITALTLVLSSMASAGEHHHHHKHMRMDCRFYGHDDHACVASATYKVQKDGDIDDIRYGVSCDRQTIYNDGGTLLPIETVADGIRPDTAAVPRVELMPQGSLSKIGTYTAKIELENREIMNGSCFVTKQHRHHDDQDQDDQDQGDGQDHDHPGTRS